MGRENLERKNIHTHSGILFSADVAATPTPAIKAVFKKTSRAYLYATNIILLLFLLLDVVRDRSKKLVLRRIFFFFFLPRCIYDAYIIMYHHSIVQSHIIQLAAPPLLRDRPRGLSIGRWRHTRSMSNGAVADGINVLSHCIRAHD